MATEALEVRPEGGFFAVANPIGGWVADFPHAILSMVSSETNRAASSYAIMAFQT